MNSPPPHASGWSRCAPTSASTPTISAWRSAASRPKIVRVARAMQCDLIVLGARERHGLSIFVNLTEDTVLHAAPCDVLAVRVSGEQVV